MAEKAVIFDLDGTLLDTLPDLASAVNRALAGFGLPERDISEIHSFIGDGTYMLVKRSMPENSAEADCRRVHSAFRAEYEAHLFDLTLPYEGISALLKALSDAGIGVSVVTNKDDGSANAIIGHFFPGVVRITRGVLSPSERKPDPRNTLSVISALSSTPSDAVFVGDGINDLLTASAAGTSYIPVGYGYGDPALLALHSGAAPVDSVAELTGRLRDYFIF